MLVAGLYVGYRLFDEIQVVLWQCKTVTFRGSAVHWNAFVIKMIAEFDEHQPINIFTWLAYHDWEVVHLRRCQLMIAWGMRYLHDALEVMTYRFAETIILYKHISRQNMYLAFFESYQIQALPILYRTEEKDHHNLTIYLVEASVVCALFLCYWDQCHRFLNVFIFF